MVEATTKQVLDRTKFKKQMSVTQVTVPCALISEFQKTFKLHLLKFDKVPMCKAIEGDTKHKTLLLDSKL